MNAPQNKPKPQFKIGDVAIAVAQGVEQTPPLKVVDVQRQGDDVFYKLDDESKTLWPDLVPGDATTWALAHLRLGFSVIPIEPGGKRPPCTGGHHPDGRPMRMGWKRYQTERALEATVTSWADRWPGMNHAFATGTLSGIVVLDIDAPEGEKYARDHGLPQTPTATTGKGKHYYFKCPNGEIRNLARPVAGLDLRANGGYVVAPGSFHGERQTTYRWMVAPWECEFADMPEWLLDLTREPERPPVSAPSYSGNGAYAEAAMDGELGRLVRAAPGSRNDQLNRSAFALGQLVGGGALDEGDVRRSLGDVAQAIGLHEHEAEATITSGLASGRTEPREIPEQKTALPELPPLPGPTDAVDAMGALAELKKKQDAWIGSLLKTPRVPEPDWFELLRGIIIQSKMTEDEIDAFIAEVEAPPTLLKRKKTALKNEWRETRTLQAGQQILSALNVGDRPPTWPYDIKAGRLVYLSEPRGYESDIITANPIADFKAKISHEITREGGDKLFVVDGLALRGGPFSLEIAAEDFGSDNKLRAKLDAASGSLDPVRARMGNHLGPSIKLLTKEGECKKVKRYERTGWMDSGRFLIPGRPQPGIEILLKRKLPYRVDAGADLRMGLEALDSLLKSMTPERASVVAAVMFQAPLARLAGWENERYAMFIAGRSGSLKTTFAQTLFCIYGPDFVDDTLLTKWGEGATNNALMGKATIPHDMPFLIDNYKPGTGGGSKAFVGLIHNIVEGGEKERMNRASQLKDTKPLYCWPICTGEDVPDTDPASLARILVMPFLWQSGEDNDALSKAQELSPQMCAIGDTWIAWLETDDAQDTIGRIAGKFNEYRSKWSAHLRSIRKESVNKLRVASNLATNELTWEIMCEHPDIGALARKHKEAHGRGLADIIATTMAEATAEALEATRYLSALKELVAVEQVSIPDMGSVVTDKQKYNLIGWQDMNGVYLMPSVARRAVEHLVGDLNGISSLALNKQLSALGVIASTNKGRYTKNKRINGKVEQILHLRLDALIAEEPQTGAEIADEMDF